MLIRSSIQIMNQIEKNALNAKYNFENFKNSIGGQNIFKTFKLPKIHLSFEPLAEELDGKYYNNHHQNKSSKRTPKLIRATSQPPKPRQWLIIVMLKVNLNFGWMNCRHITHL
jgi:hypothetical protein